MDLSESPGVSAAEDHRVTMRDGVEIYVKLLGQNSKHRPLVIATHGGPGIESHKESENSFGFLSKSFRVLVYDIRGSGTSTWAGPYTHEQYVADLEEIRAWVGAEQFIIAGASYGGIISLEYTVRYPQRVMGLLLRNTLAVGMHLIVAGIKATLTSHRIEPNYDLLERAWIGALNDVEELAELLQDIGVIYRPEFFASGVRRPIPTRGEISPGAINVEVWNSSASYNLPRYDVRSQLPNISVPAIVVGGKQDVVTTPKHVEDLSKLIPGAELVILDGAGHNLADDEPELWRETIWIFLRAHGFLGGEP